MDRLRIAERNDTQRGGRARLRFHPDVVSRVERAWDVERTCCSESSISPYTDLEMQEALSRQMVKTHVRECLRTADTETRKRFNAVSADEAWRRADSLRVELGHVAQNEASLKQRQREAALRCQDQAMGCAAPKPMIIKGRPPLATITKNPHPDSPMAQRPPSARRQPTSTVKPGKAVRQSSPRRGPPSRRGAASPRRPPSPRSAPGASRTSTRVAAPPGGHSSIVFG